MVKLLERFFSDIGYARRMCGFGADVLLANFKELSAPYRLEMAITSRCNLRCKMCGIWQTDDRSRDLSVGEICRIISSAKSIRWLNLTGGEIFIMPDIDEIFKTLATMPKLTLVTLNTNGFEVDSIVRHVTYLSSLLPEVRIIVSVSLDGPPDVHNAIRGNALAWERAVACYLHLIKSNLPHLSVHFSMTIQDDNQFFIDETYDALRRKMNRDMDGCIHVNFAHTSAHYYNNEKTCTKYVPAPGVLDVVLSHGKKSLFDPVARVERIYQTLAKKYFVDNRCPLLCTAACVSLFVDFRGLGYPCISDNRTIGSLRDYGYDLMLLWKSDTRKSMRQDILKGHCVQCWTSCEATHAIGAALGKTFWIK